MATRTIVMLLSDLSGGDADETVTFGLDKVTYEVDLTKDEAARLREALKEYVEVARRVGNTTRSPGRRSTVAPSATTPEERAAIRAWAKENGYRAPERGRLPAATVEAYHAAQ